MLKGSAASPGYGAGQAVVLRPRPEGRSRRTIDRAQVEAEKGRLAAALGLAAQELRDLEEKARAAMGEEQARVFAAHQLLLQDPEFGGAMANLIGEELVAAETAVHEVTARTAAVFEGMADDYLRERAADMRDVGRRVLDRLLGATGPDWAALPGQVVVIAHELTPSDTAQLDRSKVTAFVTAVGGPTSHAAIMARALEIPAVVGVQGLLDAVRDGQTVLVDGEVGAVFVDPDDATAAEFAVRAGRYRERREALRRSMSQRSITPDDQRVWIGANLGGPAEVEKALSSGAEGVGLFRSEFLFLDREGLPSEEEQYQAYRQAVEGLRGRPMVVRTLDVGGDKELPYLALSKETNPFLGCRAIRFCLDRPELFRTQLRAILRAGAHGDVRLMFPMITTLSEVWQAKEQVRAAKEELRRRGLPFREEVPLGIMVETPAAALNAVHLAREVDFFSIGTNDLVQYTMACDRTNERISHLYQPLDPAVLRLIQMVIDAGHAAGKPVGMCGEMAGDPFCLPLLLGLGLDEFSMNPAAIPAAREVIARTPVAQAREIAREALVKRTSDEVREYLERVNQGGIS
ncbi:MAG TPA: phosphoenolpyruvate--protein phosphotransferase [Firmicutes bacterium]|nr:phosphoenolpyruvate--protein phosphotransferase [Bacillota bacterium]